MQEFAINKPAMLSFTTTTEKVASSKARD